jgi:hypothetical protein
MKIISISYQKAFATGPFLQEKIGVEVAVAEGMEDMAFKEAVATVERWHKEANPHLYQEPVNAISQTNPNYVPPPSTFSTSGTGPLIINLKDEKISIAIENAESVDELMAIKEANPVMKFPLMKAYNKRLCELSSQSAESKSDVQ